MLVEVVVGDEDVEDEEAVDRVSSVVLSPAPNDVVVEDGVSVVGVVSGAEGVAVE